MSYLFIDSTDTLTLGLLNKDFSWREYNFFDDKKCSAIIHKNIYTILEKNRLDMLNLDGLIYIAGPGSYTGVRVAEGIGLITHWQEKSIFSFYHFEIPKILGVEKGIWVTNAFKGEMFAHKWTNEGSSNELVALSDINKMVEGNDNIYSLKKDEITKNSILTSDLLKNHPEKIFSKVVSEKIKRDTFYFRGLEKEFRVPNI